MGLRQRRNGDTRCERGSRAERLAVDAVRIQTVIRKPCGEVGHEGGGTAQVRIRLTRNTEIGNQGIGEPALRGVVDALSIGAGRAAEADVSPSVLKLIHKHSSFFRERVLRTVAGSVHPPHLPGRSRRDQRI